MKRVISLLLMVFMLLPFCFTVNAETYIPSRTINLVYDDSGSMIRVGSDYVDTWCQAKYAMEVFAGMLGENETLNIYYMSDYANGSMSAPPKLVLHGSKDASVTEANVKMIHDLVTNASDTPFDSVIKAYTDLQNVNSDERWLVVLTDGEFNGTRNSRVENYFHECVSDGKTRVMMLSMGPNAAVITPDPENHIYFEKAENTTDILSKLTRICNRIFQSNALPISNSNEITFNVPMSQLVVFAQGKNVNIKGLTSSDGTTVQASSNVHVQYSETATNDNYYPPEKVVVADNLNGYVATYNADFEPGTYTVDVSGADNIQVYYKPNVSIAAYLYNNDNEEVTSKDNLPAGTYRLEFGFVNGTNGERVTDTSLLGDISYHASIINTTKDGVTEVDAKSGDTVTIKEGTLDIAVTASFLEYNTVHANLSYQVFFNTALIYSFEQKPTYSCFVGADTPIILNVKIDNAEGIAELTREQWDLLDNLTVSTSVENIEFNVEKTDQIGKFNIYPVLKDENAIFTGEVPLKISAEIKQGLSTASGTLNDSFEIKSNTLIFAFTNVPTYTLTVDGFANPDEFITVSVKIDNEGDAIDLTQKQWEMLGVPQFTTNSSLGGLIIEKSDTVGEYRLYPSLKDNDPLKTNGGTYPIDVSASFIEGISKAEGSAAESFEIINKISFIDRLADWLSKHWQGLSISLVILFLILGYIPPFKKYLPRKIKKRPIIECSAEKIGVKDKEVHGKFKRKTISTLIPYKAETGFVVFSPSPYKKTAQLRAAGGNGIYITNMKMFAGKEEISFNGISVPAEKTKPFRISAGSAISLRTAEYTYTCYLNR